MAATVVLFTQCKKDNNNAYKIGAYTSTSSPELFLFINNENRGRLPYLADGADDCNDAKALRISLPSGNYNIAAKDQQGNIISSFVLQLEDSEFNIVSGTGSHSLFAIDRCASLGLDN